MSFPVGQAAQALPQFGESAIVVNNGTDVVYIGVRRDTLKLDGFPLQPLSQLTLDPTQTYYALAASGTQSLDLLPGGSGFSPSPAQIASQLVASTLASAIAQAAFNQGSRLVDNNADPMVTSLAPIGAFPAGSIWTVDGGGVWHNSAVLIPIDVRQYQSFVMSFDCTSGGTLAVAQMTMYWLDENQNEVASRTYEGCPNQITLVSDNHLGPYVAFVFQNIGSAAGALGVTWRFSNRVMPGERVDCVDTENDGCLLAQPSLTVPASGSSPVYILPPVLPGAYQLHIASGFTGEVRYWNSQSGSGNHRLVSMTTPFNQIITIASTRRALYFQVNNTSATSSTFAFFVFWSRA